MSRIEPKPAKVLSTEKVFPALKPIEVRSPHEKPLCLQLSIQLIHLQYQIIYFSKQIQACLTEVGLVSSIGLCSSLGHRLGATSKVRTGSRKEKFQVACSHGNQSERHAQQRRQRVGRLALWLVDRLRQVGLDGQKKRRPR